MCKNDCAAMFLAGGRGKGPGIMDSVEIGTDEGSSAFVDRKICREDVSLVALWAAVPEGMRFQKNSQIYGLMQSWEGVLRATANYGL